MAAREDSKANDYTTLACHLFSALSLNTGLARAPRRNARERCQLGKAALAVVPG
jgi:hypothetical protein